MPWDRLGFGLDTTPATRPLPPELDALAGYFKDIHEAYTPAAAPAALLERARYAAGSAWSGWRLPLALFAVAGLFFLPPAGLVGLATLLLQLEAHRTRGKPEPVVGRLAVDQESTAGCRRVVRHARAVAAALFADDEHEPHARFAGRAQPLDGGNLRGQNPLRVARSPAEETIAGHAARKERRHAVEVGREDDARRRGEAGEHVEPALRHRLLGDGVPAIAEVRGQPPARLALPARRRIDIDERAREGCRIHLPRRARRRRAASDPAAP